jgi:hypothetical protein
MMMVIHHQPKKLESLVVVLAKRQVNDREENNLSHYFVCTYVSDDKVSKFYFCYVLFFL